MYSKCSLGEIVVGSIDHHKQSILFSISNLSACKICKEEKKREKEYLNDNPALQVALEGWNKGIENTP